jgi:hypothetical protein
MWGIHTENSESDRWEFEQALIKKGDGLFENSKQWKPKDANYPN